jgi:hypothetical protein
MDPQPRADAVYRLSTAHVIRLVAPFELLIGLAWVVGTLLGLSRGWMLALVLVTVAGGIVGAYLFVRPPAVLTLTDDGFRIGLARTAGRAWAAWREVESVGTADASGVAALVFVLADGGQSALPLSLLGSRSADAQSEVRERLNRAYGYRRL